MKVAAYNLNGVNEALSSLAPLAEAIRAPHHLSSRIESATEEVSLQKDPQIRFRRIVDCPQDPTRRPSQPLCRGHS